MAKFDEDKIINALHTDKAEVGKKYWFSDSIVSIKEMVEGDRHDLVHILRDTPSDRGDLIHPFGTMSNTFFSLIYPYEEPKRMTNEQLAEWLAKGNGLLLVDDDIIYTYYESRKEYLEIETTETFLIRPFGQTEWIEPTYEIYLKDCKGGKG